MSSEIVWGVFNTEKTISAYYRLKGKGYMPSSHFLREWSIVSSFGQV
jgi:hypothetical protein